MRYSTLFPALALAFAACGGGEPADTGADAPDTTPSATAAPSETRPSGPMTMPEWYAIDHDARTVDLTVTAGSTPTNNYWNYNGAINGAMAVAVPEGYEVTITLINEDPNMPHSIVISDQTSNFQNPPSPQPVFEGAATENPTSMVDATMPGEQETITFTAAEAGTYSMVCVVPGHSALGMWLWFDVVPPDAEVGVQGL